MPGTPGCRERSPLSVDGVEVKGGPVTTEPIIGWGCGGGIDAPVIARRPWRSSVGFGGSSIGFGGSSVEFGGSIVGFIGSKPEGIRGVKDCRACCWDWGRVGLGMGVLSLSGSRKFKTGKRTSRHLIVACGIPNAFTGSAGIETRSKAIR